MQIERNKYLNRLIVRKGNGFIKIITGIRRCGKSYLLNTLFYNHLLAQGTDSSRIIRFAFDAADDLLAIGENADTILKILAGKAKADPRKFLDYVSCRITDSSTYYLLLDEIQNLDGFEFVLNGFLRKGNIDVYVTGSNSKFLSSDVVTEFAGRGDEVRVAPLSFAEYWSVQEGKESKEEAFDEYMIYGGLPAICSMQTEEQKSKYLAMQMSNVYLRDVVERNNLNSDTTISELVDVLASGISCLTNPRKLADTFKCLKNSSIAPTTIDRYISHLEDAFIISKAKRYDVKGRRYIGTPYKLYFEDVGLRNARLNFRQIEASHIMENVIYNELRIRGYSVDVGVVEKRENQAGAPERTYHEIDFIANMGSKRYYVQSAYAIPDEEKRKQETASFDMVNDSFKKIILVEKTMKPQRDEKGYVTMGVKEFLLNENSLDS